MKNSLIGLFIAAILLGGLVIRVDVGEVTTALHSADWGILGLAMAIRLVSMSVKTIRWGALIEAAYHRRLWKGLFSASFIGFAGNMVLPARMGDFARALAFRRRTGVPLTLSLTTGAVPQVLDTILLLAVLAALSWIGDYPHLVHAWIPSLLGVLCIGGLAAALLMIWQGKPIERFLVRLSETAANPVRRHGIQVFQLMLSGLAVIQSSHLFLKVLGLSILTWSLEVAVVWLALGAFDIQATLTMAGLLMAVLNLAFAIPLTPANVGTHQLLSVLVLSLFAVSEPQALSFSIGLQATAITVTTTLGVLCAVREGLSVRDVRRINLRRTVMPDSSENPTRDATWCRERKTLA